MPLSRLCADNTKVWLVDLLSGTKHEVPSMPSSNPLHWNSGVSPASGHIHSHVGAGVSIVHSWLRKCNPFKI